MTDVSYPAVLPGVQPGALSPAMRRASSSMDGVMQLRARQRSFAGAISQHTFVYTAPAMAIWRDWFTHTLLDGRRWFAIALPGEGGLQTRVARYLQVQEALLGVGIYRVTATLEHRGASRTPVVQPVPTVGWLEDFGGCSLGAYSAVSGDQGIFSIVNTEFGCSLQVAAQNVATVAAMKRDTVQLEVWRWRLKFRLTALNSDDAASCALLMSGSGRIGFQPRREAAFDAAQRPQVTVNGESAYAAHASLEADVWYLAQVDISVGAGNTSCTITRLSDDLLIASVSLAGSHSPQETNELFFAADRNGLTSPVQFDDIDVNWTG